ncbi:hypothetical protein FBF86_20925 [Serratia marcescens]|uniref:MrpH family fimbial adhesin n=1 Tax=Serratia marcescens TaxID=615 RepID=UPI00114F3080|nr:hypothetical protein [Serratia marcescens]QDI20295.1 hypothetical protein FBF86_20925 [Serratia marcescens]QDI30039.1 hypothetical protein FG169_20925 [Serratia marcescens]QDI44543.1 hypothetical protein FG172_21150 [Serratia marcescens]QDI58968.1 hypothetical protein FG175_21150 [Serratia marcescens]QLJ67560.1 hypothetical protein HP437_21280 [Serratia marcescens]
MRAFVYGVLMMGALIPRAASAMSEAIWTWDGATTLKYNLIRLENNMSGGDSRYNCGVNGKNCSVKMYVNYDTENRLLWTDNIPYVSGTMYGSEIIANYNNYKLPKSGSITNYKYKDCVQIFLTDGRLLGRTANSCAGTLNPPPPPPSSVSCYMNPVEIKHPPLQSDEINGKTISVNMAVVCTGQATVRISALANDGSSLLSLRGDGSLKSELSVNGQSGTPGALVTVPGYGGASVSFSSKLVTSGNVAAGDFRGTGVVKINIL